MKKLNVKMMTKQIADLQAKEIEVRGKKTKGGLSVKQDREKGKKGK